MTTHTTYTDRPGAVVMNMFYTGLGAARSLGERGISVIGLSADRGIYGNFTRYAKVLRCADSCDAPDKLLSDLMALGQRLPGRAVLFPTRDHDLVFLDRFRRELEQYYVLVVPSHAALERCLNKWETYRYATLADVPTPRCWLLERPEDVSRAAHEVVYPCVLKPLAAHHWRTGDNWRLVGARKVISVASAEELAAEYELAARADRRMILQEQVAGGDECLTIAACYMDRRSNFQGGFNTQKVVQVPEGFGTGCIVRSAQHPELFERTIRLLRTMEFTGIAEVEYKWDASDHEYKLIEVNPRPWDQHRLGTACGVDVIHLAYCDAAGLPVPRVNLRYQEVKWVAEDTFLMAALRLIWRREPGLVALLRSARGERIYGIWSARDPLPFLMYLAHLVPQLFGIGVQILRRLSGTHSASRPRTVRATP